MSQNFNTLATHARAILTAVRLRNEKEVKDAFFSDLEITGKDWKNPEIFSQWLKMNGEQEFTDEELLVSSDVHELLENRRVIAQGKLNAVRADVGLAKKLMEKAEAAPYEAAVKAGDPIVYNLQNFDKLRAAEDAAAEAYWEAREKEFICKKAIEKHAYLLPPE